MCCCCYYVDVYVMVYVLLYVNSDFIGFISMFWKQIYGNNMYKCGFNGI